jgi:hypothetical protein
MFSASESVNVVVVTPFEVLLCPDAAYCVRRAGTEQIQAHVRTDSPVHFGKLHPEQDLGIALGSHHTQQINRLAERLGDRHGPVRAGQVLHRAAQKDRAILETDSDTLFPQFLGQLAPQGFKVQVGLTHADVKHQPVAARLPQDQARFARGFAVDHDLTRADCHQFEDIAAGY